MIKMMQKDGTGMYLHNVHYPLPPPPTPVPWTGFLSGVGEYETAQEGFNSCTWKQEKLKKYSKYTL